MELKLDGTDIHDIESEAKFPSYAIAYIWCHIKLSFIVTYQLRIYIFICNRYKCNSITCTIEDVEDVG